MTASKYAMSLINTCVYAFNHEDTSKDSTWFNSVKQFNSCIDIIQVCTKYNIDLHSEHDPNTIYTQCQLTDDDLHELVIKEKK